MSPTRIALVGDFQPDVIAHQGIERSMALARTSVPGLDWEWIHTGSIGADCSARLGGFNGIWLVPASPYANERGALAAVTVARSEQVPFLGTCGGFQHAVIEFAREVLGQSQAGHAETEPDSRLPIIAALRCSLVEARGTVHLTSGSRLAEIYDAESAEEGYHCSYGLNPEYETLLLSGGMRIAARDDVGEVRALELPDHPCFIATLFQPERRALAGQLHPVVRAFLQAAESGSRNLETSKWPGG